MGRSAFIKPSSILLNGCVVTEQNPLRYLRPLASVPLWGILAIKKPLDMSTMEIPLQLKKALADVEPPIRVAHITEILMESYIG